jgi:NitT/TauT family transport system substrate-binding protein
MRFEPARHLLQAAMVAVLAVGLAAPAMAESLEVGTVGGPSPQLWPTLIGNAQGYFGGDHRQLSLISVPSSSGVIQQVAAGSLAMAVSAGLSDPIRAAVQGGDVALVRIDGQVPPYALLAKPDIKSLQSLKSKLVSVGGAKDITKVYLERMLAPNGLHVADVDLVYAGATSARFAALQSGAVDAAILFPPFIFRAEAAGYSNLGLVVDYASNLPFSGLAANRTWAAANPKILADVLAGYDRAVNWLSDDANRDAAIDLMVTASHSDRHDIEQTYDFFRRIHFFQLETTVSRKKLQAMVDVLQADGDIPAGVPLEKLILPGTTRLVE